MSRPKASTGSSSQTPSPPVPATPEPYHPNPIPPLVQTPPTAKPPRTVARGPPLSDGSLMEPRASGWVCWGGGRWAWHRRFPSMEGSGDLHHQGGRTDESPEQPSCPPLAQLPTASTGLGLPGRSGQRSRPGRGCVGPRLGGRAVPVHPLAGPAATAGPLLFQQRRLP